MRKRERENPCRICGHFHKYEQGEVCGVCGHRRKSTDEEGTHESAFPIEVLEGFLFLGSYDNASRAEILKTLGISHILNTVPDCHNLYNSSFTYHGLQGDRPLDFEEANHFLEQCERDKSRVLIHCMTGKNRSAAFVAAFLMKSKGWRLAESFQWVKDRRLQIQLTDASQHELQEYEQKLFGPSAQPLVPTELFASLGLGHQKPAGERTAGVNPQDNHNNGEVNPTSTNNPMDNS